LKRNERSIPIEERAEECLVRLEPKSAAFRSVARIVVVLNLHKIHCMCLLDSQNTRPWRSMIVSASIQCVIVLSLLLAHARIVAVPTTPAESAAVPAFEVTRLIFPVKLTAQLPSDKIGGMTGSMYAPRNAISRPSLQRPASPEQVNDLDTFGDWRQPFAVQTLLTTANEPHLPMDTGLLTTVTYQSGRMQKAPPHVQVGGFSEPVRLSEINASGLARKTHHGPESAEFGDGYGNEGGRVVVPVHVIWKPIPSYTAEARSKRIEGEVIIDVVFCASGHVQVLGLIQWLNYGLDETAADAVRQIKFRPASLNGKAIDFQGRVHVEFHPLSWIEDFGAEVEIERERIKVDIFKESNQ
jgi:TonB family protein